MKSIGTIIRQTRENADVTLQELAGGLCSFRKLSRMERDECDVDKFLFDVLIERLGKNPDRLECVLSKQQYERIASYDDAEEGIVEGNNSKALRGLANFRKHRLDDNTLDDFLYYRMKGFYWLERMHKPRKALGYFEQALAINLPEGELQTTNLYSTWELETFMGYGKTLFALGEKSKGIRWLLQCHRYANKWEDVGLRARVQPKCAYYLAKWRAGSLEQRIALCEEAIELLRRSTVSYLLEPLFEELTVLYQETANKEGLNRVRYFQEPLKEEIETYASKRQQDAMVFRWKQCGYHLDYEVIRGERLRQGITQSDLAGNIYRNPASLSQIESGKTPPNKKGFEKLMERLGVKRARMASFVAVNSFEELECIWKIRKAVAYGSHEKAKQLLDEYAFDASEQVELYRFLLDFKEGKVNGETYAEAIEAMLETTYPLDAAKYFRTPFQWEMDAVVTWGSMRENTDPAYVLSVLQKIDGEYQKSRRSRKYCYRMYSEMQVEIMFCLVSTREGKRMKRLVHRLERYELFCGKGGVLSDICSARTQQETKTLSQSVKDAYKSMVFAELFYDGSLEEKRAYYVCYERKQHSAEE